MLGTAPWRTMQSFLKPCLVCVVGPHALAEPSARWDFIGAWPCTHSLWFLWLQIVWNLSFWWYHWIALLLVSKVMFFKAVQTQTACLEIGNCLSSLLLIFFCSKRNATFIDLLSIACSTYFFVWIQKSKYSRILGSLSVFYINFHFANFECIFFFQIFNNLLKFFLNYQDAQVSTTQWA